MAMITFSDNKAGMSGLDKDKIQKIIDESTGEHFGAFAKKKEQRLEQQKDNIRLKVNGLSDAEKKQQEMEMRELCDEIEMERDLSRHCVHIDMDAFYASVEMRDEPRLRNVPMAVGGSSMLSTSNYEARQFGVRAGMPGFIGLKLCPQLEIIPCNFDKYTRESGFLSSILLDYDPLLSMGSLDEAYLDITQYLHSRTNKSRHTRIRYKGECICRLPILKDNDRLGVSSIEETEQLCSKCSHTRIVVKDEVEFGIDRSEVVNEMRFRVEQSTGLTCSAGIAPNFMLAKICSDQNKPNGQFELKNDLECVKQFLFDLPTRKVAGIGRVSEAHLSALNIFKCSDIIKYLHLLPCAFSPLGCDSMIRIGLGIGSNTHTSSTTVEHRKSMSVERSFSPSSHPIQLKEMLRDLSETLCEQASSRIKGANGLSIKVKLSSFDVLTRSASIPKGSNLLNADTVYNLSCNLLDNILSEGKELRLLGVRLYKLILNEKNERSILQMFKKRKIENEEKEEEEGGGEEEEEGEGEGGEEGPCCPICSFSLQDMDDRKINTHMDECLNKEVIKDVLINDAVTPSTSTQLVRRKSEPPKKKQKTILAFFPKANSSSS